MPDRHTKAAAWETEAKPTLVLTDDEIAALNAARTILTGISSRTSRTYDAGRVDAAAEAAQQGITTFLVHAKVWGDCPITDKQLHNRD